MQRVGVILRMLGHGVIYLWAVLTLKGLLLCFAVSSASSAEVSPAARSLLSKRAFVMLCPGTKITAGLPSDYKPNYFDGVTSLCFASGCECAADKTVQCDRDLSDSRLYDTFSAHCKDPWCHCVTYKEIANGIDPRPISETQSETSFGSPPFEEEPPCLNDDNKGWCTSGAQAHPRCCDGYQCIPQPTQNLGILLGLKTAVKVSRVAIGICVAAHIVQQARTRSVNDRRDLLAKRRDYAMACPNDLPPLDPWISRAKPIISLYSLCLAAGCSCLPDGSVHCSIDRANTGRGLYAEFAEKCEMPSWCICRPQITISRACVDANHAGWCALTAPRGTATGCCEGYQCDRQQLQQAALETGIRQALSYAVGTCVSSLIMGSSLIKRAKYDLTCPQELSRLEPTTFSQSTMTTLALCSQAGCRCLDDGTVFCSVEHAVGSMWAYARYAAKCENPSWCSCEIKGKPRTKPDKPRYLELPVQISRDVCIHEGQPGYCLPGVPSGEPNLCCDGLQCLEQPVSIPIVQFGIQKALDFALGTCVSSFSSRSGLSKRVPLSSMICPNSLPKDVSDAVPRDVKTLVDLYLQAGCRCHLDGNVYCAMERAKPWQFYALYAPECERPSWCTCVIPSAEAAASTYKCYNSLQAIWFGYLADARKFAACCEGSKLVQQVSETIGVLYGVRQALDSTTDLIVGLCVDSKSLQHRLIDRSASSSYPSPNNLISSIGLVKREEYEMHCIKGSTTVRLTLGTTLIEILCRDAGCKCLPDGTVHCSLGRAQMDPDVYAEFACRCEDPSWCMCKVSADPKPIGLEACWKVFYAGWSVANLSPPGRGNQRCCEGSQFVPYLSNRLKILFGIPNLLDTATALVPGICLSSQDILSRAMPIRNHQTTTLQLAKRANQEMRCDDIGLPTTGYPTRFYNSNSFIGLFDLCFQVGCRCGFDDTVHCAVARADDLMLWASFHLKCETEQWCQCYDTKLEQKPVSETTVQGPRNQRPASPSVGNWCSVVSSNGDTASRITCVVGQYCIPWSGVDLSVQYGILSVSSTGICFLVDVAASVPAKRNLPLNLILPTNFSSL